jgi:hypothetical protein
VLDRLTGRLGALSTRLAHARFDPVMVFARHGLSEVAKTLPERPPNFGQPLGSEHEQRDHENKKQMRWLEDIADHIRELRGSRPPCGYGELRIQNSSFSDAGHIEE